MRRSEVWARNILIFLGCLVLLVVTLALWRVWFAPPEVIVSTQGDQVIVSNILLGEYYLGFQEAMVQDGSTRQTIWHARRDKGEEVSSLSFQAGVNVTPQRWTLIEPNDSETFTLSPDVRYQLIVWGNNGFSVTSWSGRLLVPTPSR